MTAGQPQDRDERTGAELLREAARLMRERAEDVWNRHAGPWHTEPGYAGHTVIRCVTDVAADDFGPGGEADTFVLDIDTTSTAEHIASWHPAVALAVADWLDWQAGRADSGNGIPAMRGQGLEQAIATARAYLAAPVSAGEPKGDA